MAFNPESFHPFTLSDREWYIECTRNESFDICNYTFASNYLWGDGFGCKITQINNCALFQHVIDNKIHYSFPLGGTTDDKLTTIRELIEYSIQNNYDLVLFPLTTSQRHFLEEHFGDVFEINSDRNSSDYYYQSETLSKLAGKKLSAKRNHINNFEKLGEWHYEPINSSNKHICMEIEQEWLASKDEHNKMMDIETTCIKKALDAFEILELVGGILYLEDRPVAFSIGERISSQMIDVHFEKALSDVPGAFQMINREFAKYYGNDYEFINREEDMGESGLRKAKSSYFPYYLALKHCACITGYTHAYESDYEDIIRIWHDSFGDDREYIMLYINNRLTPDNMLCKRINEKIVSFINLLPASIKLEDGEQEVYYLYAVATDPAHRKKGYATELIMHASRQYGKPLILRPGEIELFNFYSKMGFKDAFAKIDYKIEKPASTRNNSSYSVIDEASDEIIKKYLKSRQKAISSIGDVQWDLDSVGYAIKENEMCGGYLLQTGSSFIMVRPCGSILSILETTAPNDVSYSVISNYLSGSDFEYAQYQSIGGMILSDCEYPTNILNLIKE